MWWHAKQDTDSFEKCKSINVKHISIANLIWYFREEKISLPNYFIAISLLRCLSTKPVVEWHSSCLRIYWWFFSIRIDTSSTPHHLYQSNLDSSMPFDSLVTHGLNLDWRINFIESLAHIRNIFSIGRFLSFRPGWSNMPYLGPGLDAHSDRCFRIWMWREASLVMMVTRSKGTYECCVCSSNMS